MTLDQVVSDYNDLGHLLLAIHKHSCIQTHLDTFLRLMTHHAECIHALSANDLPVPSGSGSATH